MPELPEVQTTVSGLRDTVIGLTIVQAWSDYDSPHFKGSETIKDPLYFKQFKRYVEGAKIVAANRRAKNILISLDNGWTILIHMKMTGHLLYGVHGKHIHFLLNFSNGKSLALSDVRKFAKVTLVETAAIHFSDHLRDIGPEPLDAQFTFSQFEKRIDLRPHGKIKQILMDQSVIAGIGNIYADESLWRAGIHPLQKVSTIPTKERQVLFTAIKKTLLRGIDFGGDSTSDYRNIYGEQGSFHEQHSAYRKTGTKCLRKGCGGTIVRISLGGRGTHFCNKHQKIKQ